MFSSLPSGLAGLRPRKLDPEWDTSWLYTGFILCSFSRKRKLLVPQLVMHNQ